MTKLYRKPESLSKHFSETRYAFSPEAQLALRLVGFIGRLLNVHPPLKRGVRAFLRRSTSAETILKIVYSKSVEFFYIFMRLYRSAVKSYLSTYPSPHTSNHNVQIALHSLDNPDIIDLQFAISNNAQLSNDSPICVVIPVYNAYEDFLRCLQSVLQSFNETQFSVLIINDCSTDQRIAKLLQRINHNKGLQILSNYSNLGFVVSVNRGFFDAYSKNKDIIILNSDTIVFDHWIDRLSKAGKYSELVGTVTPLTNNGTIASFPRFLFDNHISVEDARCVDECAAKLGIDKFTITPTGVGFCMLIKRKLIDEIGGFDAETFGRGYGEENDFCQRAILGGWQNIVSHSVFIYHAGNKSFGDERSTLVQKAMHLLGERYPQYHYSVQQYIDNDPGYELRQDLTRTIVSRHFPAGSVLFVAHAGGGGVNTHMNDLAKLWNVHDYVVIVARPRPDELNFIRLELIHSKASCLVDMFDLPQWNTKLNPEVFAERLSVFNVKHIHIHHLLGYGPDGMIFWKRLSECLRLDYDVTIHDYAFICPQIHLVDASNSYCGEPSIAVCEECVLRNGSPYGRPAMWSWREASAEFLSNARRVFVPHQDVSSRLVKYFPKLPINLRSHSNLNSQIKTVTTNIVTQKYKKRLGFIGAIGIHKGSLVLEQIARFVKEHDVNLELIVIGHTDRDSELAKLGVIITGKYSEEDIGKILIQNHLAAVFISSVWPETYSYTLSQVLACRIFAIAFDLGAPPERIREARAGAVIDFNLVNNTSLLVETLLHLCEKQPSFDQNASFDIQEPWDLESYYEL